MFSLIIRQGFLLLWQILVLICASSDLLKYRMSNRIICQIAFVGIAQNILFRNGNIHEVWLGLLPSIPFFVITFLRPKKLGGADAKFVAAAGVFLGFEITLWAVFAALVCALLIRPKGREPTHNIEIIPLGWFLGFGFFILSAMKIFLDNN
ncbi:MAG: prepilin peptidase [Lachnospiraceae bacterium]|jgi:Flp pilus assembly protein protease CpaA|nr:prepilin peptidase [Lachnospiraceae bacterium]